VMEPCKYATAAADDGLIQHQPTLLHRSDLT
jgi:hypothetical protein